MNQDHREFMNLRRLPGSITAEQAALLLGIPVTCIAVLIGKGFVKPLGKNVAPNAPKRFASAAIITLTQNPEEMHKMQHLLSSYWRQRNGKQNSKTSGTGKSGEN